MLSPEKQAEAVLIRQELLTNPSPERARELSRKMVALVREARGVVAAAVEAKRPAKRAAKVDGNAILNDFLEG
jgi:hypothetical protein